jgi:hypothetical protein
MTEEVSGKKLRQPLFSAELSEHGYTVIQNSLLLNSSISFTAKGILLTCLSVRHSFNKEWITAHGKDSPETISSALRELLAAGYLKRVGHADACLYQFTDCPQPVAPQVQPEVVTRRRSSRAVPPSEPIALEPWLEPYRKPLEQWLVQRLREHPRLPWGITERSMAALVYANEQGVIAEFCQLASEATWQSLGFNGYKDYIDKLVKEKRGKASKPSMSQINYTLK